MSTKKGYIVKDPNGTWVIAEYLGQFDRRKSFSYSGTLYVAIAEIHPDSLPTILSNGSLKPAYQGEVEYEEERAYEVIIKNGTATKGEGYTTYAIPKPVESKGDVWEEAMDDAHNYADKEGGGCYMLWEYRGHQLNYLKQHYNITKKHP